MRKSSVVNAISVRHGVQARLCVIVRRALYIVPSLRRIRCFLKGSWQDNDRTARGVRVRNKDYSQHSMVVLGTVGNNFRVTGNGCLKAILKIKGK